MAQPYCDDLRVLLQRLRAATDTKRIECRHFFSGAALYLDGRIFCSLTPVGLAVKLAARERDALLAGGAARPLRYFPDAPVKKEYVLLPAAVLENPERVDGHVRDAMHCLRSTPGPANARLRSLGAVIETLRAGFLRC